MLRGQIVLWSARPCKRAELIRGCLQCKDHYSQRKRGPNSIRAFNTVLDTGTMEELRVECKFANLFQYTNTSHLGGCGARCLRRLSVSFSLLPLASRWGFYSTLCTLLYAGIQPVSRISRNSFAHVLPHARPSGTSNQSQEKPYLIYH